VRIAALCALGAAILLPRTASSADFEIFSPTVEQGVLELEAFGQRSVDPSPDKSNEQVHKFEFSYGVNSWWKTGVELKLKKEPQSNLVYDATAWENIVQLTPQAKYWLDFGLFIEYEHPVTHAAPDEVQLRLLFEKEIELLVVTVNANFSRRIGQNAGQGLEFGYAVRAKYPWKRELQFGVEAFGEPGRLTGFETLSEQEHVIGPVLLGKFNFDGVPGSFNYTAGYLFGLTSGTPKGTAKWKLEYEIPF
jgi:hypothetical protein